MMVTQAAPDDPYVFVSYASVDGARIEPLVAALTRAGISVWLDQSAIEGGANYAMEIAEGIERCAALMLMCSAASLASRNVRQEIALGWKYERPYVPLLLEPVTIPKEIEYWLEAAQWIEVFDKPEAEWLPAVLAALAPLGIAPAADRNETMLAGRARELTALRDRLTSAIGGQGNLVLIGGEAGIGKTTLAEAVCREAAQRGALVLTGRCFDLAETPPYGPWLYLFERYPAGRNLPPLPSAFAEPGRIGDITSQATLFRQVLDCIKAVTATRPLVLLLDDYHWADPASLDLLRYLTQSIATLPVVMLVTYRSDELTRRHPLYHLLPLLVREAGAARLDLRRLDDDAVRALVTDRYGLAEADAARLATYLQSRAEGNALFLGELLRSLEEARVLRQEGDAWVAGELTQSSVPPLLRQVIDGRLARLDDESQRLLAVAAIIGHEVPLAVWATVGEVDEDALLDVVEQGIEARLLIESPDGEQVRFAHALIRESLYEGILATRRRRLHRRVGEALASTRDPDPDAVAYHFERAGDERAVTWLIAAGERAQWAFAWPTAVARYEAALALAGEGGIEASERGWLLYRVARLLRHTDRERALRYLHEAAGIADTLGERALATAALFAHGHILSQQRGAVGNRMVEAALVALDALSPEETAQIDRQEASSSVADMRGYVLLTFALAGRSTEVFAAVERAPVVAAPIGVERGAVGDAPWRAIAPDGYQAVASAHAVSGRPAAAREAIARSLALARATGYELDVVTALRLLILDVLLPYGADAPTERRRVVDEADARLQRIVGLPIRGAFSSGWTHADSDVLEGRWQQTEGVLLSVIAARESYALHARKTYGEIKCAQGAPEAAWEQVRGGIPDGPTTTPGTLEFKPATELLRLAAALPDARAWLDTHDRWLAWSRAVPGQSEEQVLWARYHRQSGDSDQAYEHAERALAHASEPRQPLALLAAHRLLGELDTDAGQYEGAETHLDASLALADACEAPYERALTLLAMAELRAAMGEDASAQTLIDEVRAICEPLSAKPALTRADALAARLAE